MGRFPRATDSCYEERMRINARRVRLGWGQFLTRFEWERFITLTTDPTQCSHISEERVSRDVHRLCCEFSYLSRFSVRWAYAVEGGGGPRLHAHVLVMNESPGARRAALAGWKARNGSVTHDRPVDDVRAACDYLCKCIGGNGEIVLSDSLMTRRE
jgi:hypothetical protein